jgi:hypothetical protein
MSGGSHRYETVTNVPQASRKSVVRADDLCAVAARPREALGARDFEVDEHRTVEDDHQFSSRPSRTSLAFSFRWRSPVTLRIMPQRISIASPKL